MNPQECGPFLLVSDSKTSHIWRQVKWLHSLHIPFGLSSYIYEKFIIDRQSTDSILTCVSGYKFVSLIDALNQGTIMNSTSLQNDRRFLNKISRHIEERKKLVRSVRKRKTMFYVLIFKPYFYHGHHLLQEYYFAELYIPSVRLQREGRRYFGPSQISSYFFTETLRGCSFCWE